ncbi:hypothetical protein [Endozoicomonas sp. 8E]|uniref:hypothetical protein n=1 Tax=Endozoicomonas sp. 8E TaxID=3035692 RepID=UPI00293912EC|nr:hypothetical protein [Endozoicomonas sp. 8E]WOG27174.1 hypothetical protein P6910_21890 [Endozoicomonas sp. 8E]
MKKWLLAWGILCFSMTAHAQSESDDNNNQRDSHDYIVTLVRHGDRSPRYPLNPELWPMGPGEMTDIGFKQCYEAGKHFRRTQLQADFPSHWNPELSYHQARGLDRTIQCATTMLQAIYPDSLKTGSGNEFAAVPPVYAYPLQDDYFLGFSQICTGFKALIGELQKSPLWQKKAEEMGLDRIRFWAKQSGNKPTLHAMMGLADALHIRKLHNLPMPEFLTLRDEQQLEDLIDWFMSQMSKDRRIVQLANQHLMKAIDQRYQQYQSCLESGRTACEYFYLLSVSDGNILALMTALGSPRESNVPYTSMLTLRFSASNKTVQASLNDEPLALSCGKTCSLEQWGELVASVQSSDWSALCQLKESETHLTPDISTGTKKEK